ncbi:MAG: glycine zipper 2TM domain-containing protein [Pseudomonadota bacterium]
MSATRTRVLRLPILLAAGLALAACQQPLNSNNVPRSQVGVAAPTSTGVVESIRIVNVTSQGCGSGSYRYFYDGYNSGCRSGTLGTILGAVAGGLIGSTIGGGTGRAVAIGVGSAVGAVAGRRASQAVQQEGNVQQAAEYVVRLESGRLVTVVQANDPNIFRGSSVFVQGTGNGARITPRA